MLLRAPEDRHCKSGSVIEAVYAFLDRSGGTASVEDLVAVCADFRRPTTGVVMGRSAGLQTIKWMAAKRRLTRANGEPVQWERA